MNNFQKFLEVILGQETVDWIWGDLDSGTFHGAAECR